MRLADADFVDAAGIAVYRWVITHRPKSLFGSPPQLSGAAIPAIVNGSPHP
jgi:hypothetical protein